MSMLHDFDRITDEAEAFLTNFEERIEYTHTLMNEQDCSLPLSKRPPKNRRKHIPRAKLAMIAQTMTIEKQPHL